MSALVVSALAVILAAFALAPGMRFYNDANELVATEPAFPHVLALGALGFAALGGVVARWPSPVGGLAWIAAGAGGVALWLSSHLLDHFLLRSEATVASNIAGGMTLLGVLVGAVLAVTCLVILCVRAIKQLRTPVATAPTLRD